MRGISIKKISSSSMKTNWRATRNVTPVPLFLLISSLSDSSARLRMDEPSQKAPDCAQEESGALRDQADVSDKTTQ